MPVNRFFIDAPLNIAESLEIAGEELAHMHVLRLGVGEQVELVNGKGSLAVASIEEIGKRKAIVRVEKVHFEKAPHPRCILAVPMLRMAKLELVIEKGTELGVSSFYIYTADHSEKEGLSAQQKARLQNLLISALKQCGRLYLPDIHEYGSLQEVPLKQERHFFGNTQKQAPLLVQASLPLPLPDTLLFTGPEKGFSKDEVAHFQRHNILGVSLAPYILKAETAALAGAVLIIHFQMCN